MRTTTTLTLLTALLTAGGLSAQTPRCLVSTTGDVNALGTTDGDVLAIGGGAAPRRIFGPEHFRALYGEIPGDVDALAVRPGGVPGTAHGFAFSLLSNEGGFLDGDVLGLAPGGQLEILVAEDELALALGVTGTTLDVDAAAFDAAGRLVFSLQADVSTTALGAVEDGDILRREADGSVTRLFTESAVATDVEAATGAAASIIDVQGVHIDNDEVWVCVQSPSDYDGAVIALGVNARVVMTEIEAGLGGAELNALSIADGAEGLMLEMAADTAAVGASLTGTFRGLPNDALLVLWSGSAGTVDFAAAPGFGRWLLDPMDPWLIQSLSILPTVVLDTTGEATVVYTPPANVAAPGFDAELGWSFQALSLSTLWLAAPVRVATL